MRSLGAKTWFNAIWFQAMWLTCVLGQTPLAPLALALLLLHLCLVPTPLQEIKLIVLCGLIGIGIDSMLAHLQVFQFTDTAGPIPLWLVALWFGFSATLQNSLSFFHHRPLIASIFGGVGGAMSYFAGLRFGAVEFPLGITTTLMIVAGIWAVLFPAFCWLTKRLQRPIDVNEVLAK